MCVSLQTYLGYSPAPPVQVSFDGEITSSKLVSIMAFFRTVLFISRQFSACWDVKKMVQIKLKISEVEAPRRAARHSWDLNVYVLPFKSKNFTYNARVL